MINSVDIDTILKLAEIVSIIGGGGMVAFRLGRTTSRVEASLNIQNKILESQSEEITSLKLETRKIGDVLTAIAVQGTRIQRVEDDLRELKHGRGFVRNKIEGEY